MTLTRFGFNIRSFTYPGVDNMHDATDLGAIAEAGMVLHQNFGTSA